MTEDNPLGAKIGSLLRCVDASVRQVAPGAIISDFEKWHAEAHLLDVMEILTIRELERFGPFGKAWAVRFKELDRGLEGIRRYHAKKVYQIDRPFLLDRFVLIRDDDGDREPVRGPAPRERVDA